jgi:hypothetical protein
MTTARTAFEALKNSVQEQADTAKGEALNPENDELAQAEARGNYAAYQAIANQMVKIQA